MGTVLNFQRKEKNLPIEYSLPKKSIYELDLSVEYSNSDFQSILNSTFSLLNKDLFKNNVQNLQSVLSVGESIDTQNRGTSFEKLEYICFEEELDFLEFVKDNFRLNYDEQLTFFSSYFLMDFYAHLNLKQSNFDFGFRDLTSEIKMAIEQGNKTKYKDLLKFKNKILQVKENTFPYFVG